MYYYLNGTLYSANMTFAVVECGGVGYRAYISANTFSAIASKVGKNVMLFTYLSVREDAMELFGFATQEEKRAYELLISVSGIGPKAAMAILSALSVKNLTFAILSGDVRSISSANGVGAKTAARVVLELKDKIGKEFPDAASADSADDSEGIVQTQSAVVDEAREVLLTLGYTRSEVLSALKGINAADVDSCVREALRKLMK
jgi:Holliday junction DNA helicase RuvA